MKDRREGVGVGQDVLHEVVNHIGWTGHWMNDRREGVVGVGQDVLHEVVHLGVRNK